MYSYRFARRDNVWKRSIAVVFSFCLLLQPLASQEVSISVKELLLMLELSGNSKLLDENLSVLIEGFKTSQKSEDLILNEYDQSVTSLSESVSSLETNNDGEKDTLSNLNDTVTTVVQTTEDLKPSFWKSPIGTTLKILGIAAVSFGAGYGVCWVAANL